jgi:DNA-binding response OmpR family regulator
MKILLADDDPTFCDATAFALEREGFHVVVARDGAEALRRWQVDRPDVVLLDVTMPQINGFELCRRIRKTSETPVVIVTGASDERQVLQGFASGADDYVVKPFSSRELGMRIRAVSARKAPRVRAEAVPEFGIAGVVLDREVHQVRKGDAQIQLTPLEFRILDTLAANEGHVVSFARLVELAWGFDGGNLVSLRHHVSNLRRKLRRLPDKPLQVDVVYGAGYLMNARTR